ncbi:MAG: type II toxin-antitoxin system RelE/ParE family toxin [Candidatus Lambdaproteobacteria bacterium]|nr:type II toxin-antitoxin system RelE/ParE family toxin [Candidatus Lambdaproteobacteria bacterium]
MIRSLRHRGLARLFMENDPSRLRPDLVERIRRRLGVLHLAKWLEDLHLPGFDFHKLRGKPLRYTIHVNGPWCITFEWIDGDAWRVDLEQYH